MIELSCQSCGEKAGVQSFLAAAQQPCGRCGQLLMGQLSRGGQTIRSVGGAAPPPSETRTDSPATVWLGIFLGAAAGVALVVGITHAGPALSGPVRSAVLGALMGVLLAPVLAISGFISMFVLPFSIEGLLGGSMWERVAKGLRHGEVGPLFLPLLIYVVLPMAVCAYGATKVKPTSGTAVAAGMGAALLGAIIGGICGSLAGKARQPV